MQTTNLAAIVALLVTFGPAVYWMVGLIIDLKNGATNGAVTRLLALVVAFAIANLIAHAGISFGSVGNPLAHLNWCALLIGAWVFAANGGLIADHLSARNNADTSVRRRLLRK